MSDPDSGGDESDNDDPGGTGVNLQKTGVGKIMKTECMPKYRTADPEYQARIDKIHDTEIYIDHYRYCIRVLNMYGQCTVCLDPYGSGDVAESGTDHTDYGYTHGGKNYRLACDVADDFDQYISGNSEWIGNAENPTKKYAKKHGI